MNKMDSEKIKLCHVVFARTDIREEVDTIIASFDEIDETLESETKSFIVRRLIAPIRGAVIAATRDLKHFRNYRDADRAKAKTIHIEDVSDACGMLRTEGYGELADKIKSLRRRICRNVKVCAKIDHVQDAREVLDQIGDEELEFTSSILRGLASALPVDEFLMTCEYQSEELESVEWEPYGIFETVLKKVSSPGELVRLLQLASAKKCRMDHKRLLLLFEKIGQQRVSREVISNLPPLVIAVGTWNIKYEFALRDCWLEDDIQAFRDVFCDHVGCEWEDRRPQKA